MQHVKLNHFNRTAVIKGDEQRKSIRLKSVKLVNGPETEKTLQVRMLDEKDIPIYSKHITFSPGQSEINIDHELVFYGHMSIQICNLAMNVRYDVEVYYE